MSLERIQKINVSAFEASAPKNAGKAEDLSGSTVPMTSGEPAKVNLDNPLEAMGLKINPNPDIPPTPANRPVVKPVPFPKVALVRREDLANQIATQDNNMILCYNDEGMVEKIYEGNKLKFKIEYYAGTIDKIGLYRYYNYDSKGNMIQEIFNDVDEDGNVSAYVRETIERDDEGRRTRTIRYNTHGEPNVWWEHEYQDGSRINYECHPDRERNRLGSYTNNSERKWFNDAEFYLNGKAPNGN